MYLWFEKLMPFILALIGASVWHLYGLSLPQDNSVLGSSLTIGAIFAGFLATAKAILMSLDSPVMQRIKATTYMNELVSYLAQAIWLSFSFCIVSLCGYFMDNQNYYFGMIWIAIAVGMAVAFIRFTNIMLKILKHS
jgi:hypothetical protein